MPSRLPLLFAVLSLPIFSRTGHCYEDGAPPAHTGGFGEADCSLCHSDHRKNARGGRLELVGLPDRIVPGAAYEMSVILEHPDLRNGGFQLAFRLADGTPAGKVSSLSQQTQVVSAADQDYLQHTKEGLQPEKEGIIRWAFRWVASGVSGPVHLHIAANAANDDASALGDHIFTLERVAQSKEP